MNSAYRKLSGRIAEKVSTRGEFAKRVGLSERSTSLKLNGKRPWRQRDIEKACEVLDIPFDEVGVYFFPEKF